MTTVRMVAIPEYDARVLAKGLAEQSTDEDYADSWRAVAGRMVNLLDASSDFLIKQDPTKPEHPKPVGPEAVRLNDLVAAIRSVADDCPPHTEAHYVMAKLARALTAPQTGDGAPTPPATAPTTTPVAPGGEQAAESAPGVRAPADAPSPRYSEDAVIRAYALGIANSHGRVGPSENDWAMARSWWES